MIQIRNDKEDNDKKREGKVLRVLHSETERQSYEKLSTGLPFYHTIGIIIDWILDVLTLFFYKSSTQLFWNDWKDNSQMKPIQRLIDC